MGKGKRKKKAKEMEIRKLIFLNLDWRVTVVFEANLDIGDLRKKPILIPASI